MSKDFISADRKIFDLCYAHAEAFLRLSEYHQCDVFGNTYTLADNNDAGMLIALLDECEDFIKKARVIIDDK